MEFFYNFDLIDATEGWGGVRSIFKIKKNTNQKYRVQNFLFNLIESQFFHTKNVVILIRK